MRGRASLQPKAVMPALVAGIHVLLYLKKGVDARHKAGHDGEGQVDRSPP